MILESADRTSRSWIAVWILVAITLPIGPAFAATDGAFGLLSVGTTNISIIVGETAQASGLDDIILTPWSDGNPAPVGSTQACIYSSTGGYQMTATSANAAGTRFRLSSGVNFVRYRVRWNDGLSGLTPVANGTPLTGLVGDSSDPICGGAKPVTIEVRITNADITAASFGSYADTLTVMITPQ
jgi:hypothetical protein